MRLRIAHVTAVLLCAVAVVLPTDPARADSTRDQQWHLRYLKVAEAHRYSQGEGVTVAVVDTGVEPHPDLRRNLLVGKDVVPGGTGNGRADKNGHGTGMAGLIAAHGRAGNSGVLGIAPRARIMPIRRSVVSANKSGTGNETSDGIREAVTRGADVINVSIAAGPSAALKAAIDAALAADIVVVAGAGNRPDAFGVVYPASYEGVVAVGATDRKGNHAPISITGPQVVLSAPGVDITSTDRGGGYRHSRGTSNATAIVSGAAALIRSKYPKMSAKEVVHRLTATATDKGPAGRDEKYGYGVLNLVAALTADVPPLGDSTTASTAPAATPDPASPSATPAALPESAASGTRSAGPGTALAIATAIVLVAALALIALIMGRRRSRSRSPG